MRLSASSFAGTARTLVAVGSSSDACMFLAIALAAPRSGLTVSSSASPSWDFAGVVDPAAGLVSAAASAAGRALPEPLAVPDVEAGCGDDEVDAARAGALPFVFSAFVFSAFVFPALVFPVLGALPFVVDDGVLALPLVDDRVAAVAVEAAPLAVVPVDEAPPGDAAAADDAPVEEALLAPAVFSPSAGA
jgi:hypothetical protein